MKARFEFEDRGTQYVEYTIPASHKLHHGCDDQPIVRFFSCHGEGRSVLETVTDFNGHPTTRPVCYGLESRGSVLTMEKGETLLDVIRREHRARQRFTMER